MEAESLKLARSIAIARKAVTMARVLLAESTSLYSESKREEMARWLVASEKELSDLDLMNKSSVSPGAATGAASSSHFLLSSESQDTMRSFPQRSFAVAVDSFGKVARGTLVEIVCRLPEGLSMVRPPKQNSVLQMPHSKLVVVQEGSAGMCWALAECMAVSSYAGAGPELTLAEGDSVFIIKVNSNGWWKGLKGPEAVAGLFPATAVQVTKVFSPQIEAFSKKLARAVTDEQDQPSAKLKLAMSAAIHNRGADEVSAFMMHTFNSLRPADSPPVFLSTCVLEFDLSQEDSVSLAVQLQCPDMGGSCHEVQVEVLDPRLGPNLLERMMLEFNPRNFSLSELSEEELSVTVHLLDDVLDGVTSILVPIIFSCNRQKWRSFLLCTLTTPTLKQKNRLSNLISNDHSGSSELWGETMTSADLSAAGMADLLDDLTKMPEAKSNVQKISVPPAPRSDRSGTPNLLRSSESSVINKVVSSSRVRTGSGGNREDMPADSVTGSNSSGSSSGPSPRGVLANVRARFTRGRSASSGNEDEKGGVQQPPTKDRKSPRSPRIEEATPLPPTKSKSKGDLGASLSTTSKPTALQSRSAAPVVRRRETSEVERKPGWVASLERNKPVQVSQEATEENPTSSFPMKDKTPSTERRFLPSPPAARQEKKDPGGPPKKKLPSPDTGSDNDTPIMVEIDSAEFK